MAKAVKPRILLALAILRELHNKVNYYRSVIDRNIKQYYEYIEKVSKIAPERVNNAEKEITTLKNVDRQLNHISAFLEGIILRLETLVMAGSAVTAAIALKDVVKTLKHNMASMPPAISILVDRLDEVSRSIVQELRYSGIDKSAEAIVSSEAYKIVEEAKKVAGLK